MNGAGAGKDALKRRNIATGKRMLMIIAVLRHAEPSADLASGRHEQRIERGVFDEHRFPPGFKTRANCRLALGRSTWCKTNVPNTTSKLSSGKSSSSKGLQRKVTFTPFAFASLRAVSS